MSTEKTAGPLGIRCSYCGVEPGEKCRTSGEKVTITHNARGREYQQMQPRPSIEPVRSSRADDTLTAHERVAIEALQRAAKMWPATLWLFSASGTLHVMRKGPRGEHVETETGGMDPSYSIATVEGIDNDGGDW